MIKYKGLVKAFIVMLLMSVCGLLSGSSCYAASDIPVVQAPDKVQSIRKSDTSIQIRWESIPDVDGYIIYRYHVSSKKYKEIHTIKSSSIKKGMTWIGKHLRTNKVYKYKMASYKIIDGKTQVSDRSDWVSAKTYKRNSKKINARAPKVSKKEVYLGLCTAKKVTAYSKLAKYGKNKKKKVISNQIRWNSSDPAVARVDKKGVITAGVKAGTCSVYAKAHNGTRTKIKVIVKNYARAKSYDGNYLEVKDIYLLVTDYKRQIQNIAEYYSIHRIKMGEKISLSLNKDAEVVITPPDADIGNLQKDIETLLVDFPYYISINVYGDFVDFILRQEDSKASIPGHVIFWCDTNCNKWETVQIASHWVAYRRYPI